MKGIPWRPLPNRFGNKMPTKTCEEDNNEEDEDQDRVRPSSAASTRSVPEEGYATKKAKKLKKRLWHQKEAAAPSEVGIRNVGGQIHSVYRGHQVNAVLRSSES